MRKEREQISSTVNETSTNHFIDYTRQLMPKWKDEVHSVFKSLSHNVLSREEVGKIENEYENLLGFRPIAYLYSTGLIGVPVNVSSTEPSCKQRFLSIDKMNGEMYLPDAKYYILHPCMYLTIHDALPEANRSNFHSHLFIPGNNLPCPVSIEPPKVYILFDKNNSEINVSIIKSQSWRPTSAIINENIKDYLDVNPNTNAGPTLFLSLLLAMYDNRTNYPSVKQITEAASRLVKDGFAPEILGKGNNRNTTVEYCEQQLMFGKNRSHAAQELARLVEDNGFKLETKSAMSRTSKLHIEGVYWTEIRRRLL